MIKKLKTLIKLYSLRELLLRVPTLCRLFRRKLVYHLAKPTLPSRSTISPSEFQGINQKPLISVLLPTFESNLKWLRECIDSLIAQSYPHWQLCISDDASKNPELIALLNSLPKLDDRIFLTLNTENQHICVNTNKALELAEGAYIAFLDHDDVLHPDALFHVAKAINLHPNVDFVYTDEDKIDTSGSRCDPHFKPEFHVKLLYHKMFTGHLAVYKRSLLESLGGLRGGSEGAQDWDLLLRAIEQGKISTFHIEKILYHWRMHPLSTSAEPASKPYAHEASQKALLDHFQRSGQHKVLSSTPEPGFYFWKDQP